MTRIKTIDIDPANVDPDGLADGNSSAGATVTLDGALTSGGTFTSADGLAHRLDIIDLGADDQTTATYTIAGTGSQGLAQTEAIAGPGVSATIETVSYFQTVTSIAIASPVAGSTVDIGTVDEIQTKVFPINNYNQIGATVSADVTGTIDYTVEETFDPMGDSTDPNANATWFDITALADKTTDLVSAATVGATGLRVTLNSYTDTAEAQVRINQTHN